MHRRAYLAAAATAATAAAAGCTGLLGDRHPDASVRADDPGRKTLVFGPDDDPLANLGADGAVSHGVLSLTTSIAHRDGTRLTDVALRLWTPDADTPARVALRSPVEGDSSPPPQITLSTPDDRPGQRIHVTDLDDLADETIYPLAFLVRTRGATTLALHATIGLDTGGIPDRHATLDGALRLRYPALADE